MVRFEGETFTIEHEGTAATVDAVSGWRCACGEVVFDPEGAWRYADTGDKLVLAARYFAERRERADFDAFLRILRRDGGVPPRPGDEIS